MPQDVPIRSAAQRIILALAMGELDGVTDAEVFQEILYRYLHIGEGTRGFRIFDDFYRIMLGRTLSVEGDDARQARELAERYPGLSPRDLIHLAIAQHHVGTHQPQPAFDVGAVASEPLGEPLDHAANHDGTLLGT